MIVQTMSNYSSMEPSTACDPTNDELEENGAQRSTCGIFHANNQTIFNGEDQHMEKLNDNEWLPFDFKINTNHSEHIDKICPDDLCNSSGIGTTNVFDVETHSESDHNGDLENNEFDDEFTDFASFNCEANFANFDNSNNTQYLPKSDDEEFADFETAKINNLPVDNTPLQNKPPHKQDLTQLFQSAFLKSCSNNVTNNNLVTVDLFDVNICSANGKHLWSSLQTIDLKSNFCFNKWKDSHSFKCLTESLKIGNKLVLPNDFFPAIASNHSQTLQPMTTSISTHSFDSKQYDTTIDCSSKIEPTTDCSITNDSHVLNEDLDFFESKYNYKSDSHGAKDYFIAEFENILDTKDKDTQQLTSLQSSPVNDLREMLKNSITNKNNEQVLSAEALQIISELPNLSYIRAKVLMFPISESKTNES